MNTYEVTIKFNIKSCRKDLDGFNYHGKDDIYLNYYHELWDNGKIKLKVEKNRGL